LSGTDQQGLDAYFPAAGVEPQEPQHPDQITLPFQHRVLFKM
jgi:hypothetical protein